MRTDELDFDLPESLIATRPAEPRESARLLVVRISGAGVEHRRVADLPELLEEGDHLIVNETAVLAARLAGRRADTGALVAGLFLQECAAGTWRVLLERSRRLRPGMRIVLDPEGKNTGGAVTLELLRRDDEAWIVDVAPVAPAADLLAAAGRTPLPPYILRERGTRGEDVDDGLDRAWYQTSFASAAAARSVAAPTAGLHLTRPLLDALARRGIERSAVTLDVGAGTFRPVTAEHLEDHAMHCERYAVPAGVLRTLATRAGTGRPRIVAAGTTTVRTLESLPDPLPEASAGWSGETTLLIAPPYRLRHVDVLLTNFHLPRSTLLALVAAMVGLPRLLDIYREAIAMKYRFFSYGDAMLIMP